MSLTTAATADTVEGPPRRPRSSCRPARGSRRSSRARLVAGRADGRAARGAPLRRRVHHATSRCSAAGGRHRPAARQAAVHGQHRRRRQHPAQPQPDLRPGFGVRARRQRASGAAASCSTPPFHGKSIKNYEKVIEEETLRETGDLAGGRRVRDARADEPDHAERHPARPCSAPTARELDYLREIIPPWVKLGSRLATLPEPPFNTGRYSPWGRLAEFRRKFDRTVFAADRQGRGRPALRRAHRHSRAAAAQPVRGRHADVASGHLRRAADAAWPPGMKPPRRRWGGRSSGYAAIPQCLPSSSKENDDGRQRVPPGDHPRDCSGSAPSSTSPAATSTAPHFDLGEWRIPHGYIDDGRDRQTARQSPTSSRIPSASTRTGSSATRPPTCVGAVRRWHPALHRGRVRQRRDGRRAANGVAALRDRDRQRPGREDPLPWHRVHAQGRRPHRRAPPANQRSPRLAAAARFGSFQPGRGKWQV